MAMESDKKIVIFYVLKVLQEYSDEGHYLTYNEIVQKIEQRYGVRPNVKSIAAHINTLIDAGYEINKKGSKGCSLLNRVFERGELLYLVDAIYSSKSIGTKYARDLIAKLTKDYSVYERDRYKSIEKIDEGVKIDNKQLFYTIEVLNEAIERGLKVEFQYNVYDIDKKLKPKKEGKIYKVNPYYMVNNNGKYYLICNYDKYGNLGNYKIDCITNIILTDEEIKPLKNLKGQESFSLKEYMRQHIYMFAGDSVDVTMQISLPERVNDVVNWFGEAAVLYKKDEKIFVDLKVNEDAIIYWALQFGQSVEIIKPKQTREKIKNILSEMCDKYGL